VNATAATPVKTESAAPSSKEAPAVVFKPEFAPKAHENAKSDDPKNEIMHKDA